MKSSEFVSQFVKIELIEDSGSFGHYPFQMFVEKNGKVEIHAMLLGGDVRSCYKSFIRQVEQGAETIFMSVDFPGGGDIENDFVCVFCFENSEFNVFAIPYNPKDGAKLDEIHHSGQLEKIVADLKYVNGK